MATSDETIEQVLALLEGHADETENPPAMVVMPPDSGEFIVGNRGGFVHLAIASLKAAKGEEQNFGKTLWVVEQDFDWGLAGLKFDALAHMHLPEERHTTRLRRFGMQLAGYTFLIGFGGCLVVGFITIEESVRKFFWP